MSELIRNTSGTNPALIGGCVTIFVFVIQSIFLFSKNRREEKGDFENSLKEKLEKVYSPLFMLTHKSKYEIYLLSEEMLHIINQYAHLLSTDLLKYIRNLYEIETSLSNNSTFININQKKEQENLKKQVLVKLDSEYFKLQIIKDNSFSSYSKKFTRKWYIKLLSAFAFGCCAVTIIFIVTILLVNSLSYLYENNVNPTTNNSITNFWLYVVGIIIVITTLVLTIYLSMFGTMKFMDLIFRSRKIYDIYHLVPETAIYKCRSCGKEHEFIKYDNFTQCDNHKNFLSKFKYFAYNHPWKFHKY